MANTICGTPFICPQVTLTFDLEIALPVSSDVAGLSCKHECCTVLRFRVHGEHGTDRRTDIRS